MKKELQEDKIFKEILNKYSLDFVTIKLLEKDSDFLEKMKKDYSLNCENYFDSYIKEIFKEILNKYSLDFVTIKLLEKDSDFLEKMKKDYSLNCENYFDSYIKEIEERYDEDIDTILAEKRYGKIKGIIAETLKTSLKSRLDFTEKVDKILLNRILGLPIFLMIIAGLMTIVFNGSAPFIDWIDGFVGGFIGKYAGILMEGTPDWLNSLVVDGIIGGVGGVMTFVPLMFFLYFFLSILEESGYMTRVGTPDWLNSLVVDGIIGGVGGVMTFVPLMFFLYFFLSILEESGYMTRVAFLMDKC